MFPSLHVAKSCIIIVFQIRTMIYVYSAVNTEELAGLFIELFQMFTVPVEIWREEQVRPEVYTVSDKSNKV